MIVRIKFWTNILKKMGNVVMKQKSLRTRKRVEMVVYQWVFLQVTVVTHPPNDLHQLTE